MLGKLSGLEKFLLKFLLVVAIYNHIFPVRLIVLPFLSEIIMIFSLIPFLFVLLKSKFVLTLSKNLSLYLQCLIFVCGLLFVLGFFSYLYNYSADYGFLIIIFSFLSKFVYVVFLLYWGVYLFTENEEFKLFILKIIFWSGFVVSLSVIAEVFIPSFKDFILHYLLKTSNINFDVSLRASGFATGGGATQSLVLCTTFAIGLILSRLDCSNSTALYAACSILILLSIIFVGRTGLYFSLLLGLTWIVFLSGFKSLLRFTIGIGALSLLCVYLFSTGYFTLDEGALEFYSSHSFELFNNFFETGSLQSDTTSEVSKMLYFPSVQHFIFGAGFVSEASHGYYLPDPGVMKVLLAFGIYGFIVFYTFNILSAFVFFRFFNSFKDRSVKVFVSLLMCLIFLFEFKEPGLYQNYNFKVFVLIVISYLILQRKINHR